MSDEMKDFIEKLLDWDPKNRLGVNGAEEIMTHKWFEGFDFDKLLKKKISAPYIPQPKVLDKDF